MTTDVLTIALTLAGFVLGMLIALLYAGARSRSAAEAHAARLHGLQSELAAAEKESATLRADLVARVQEVESTSSELKAVQSELMIHKAQGEEAEAELGLLADRLHAAEARLLTTDAQLNDRGREVHEWSRAYALLRATHDALQAEHSETERSLHTLEDDLQEQRLELAELGAKLEAIQGASGVQQPTTEDELATLQQRVTAISLLKATAEAGLRRRELELADVNSQLSALRYSINVLTSAAAELAALTGSSLFGIEAPVRDDEALPPRALVPLREAGDPAQTAEELAGLEGIIADWFEEVRGELPYAPAVLRAFAGAAGGPSALPTLPRAPKLEEDAAETPAPGLIGPEGTFSVVTSAVAQLPPALMLAAIKAVAKTSLERSATRQLDLAERLTEREGEFNALATRIRAWRSMLYVTLQNDPDLQRLLDQQDDSDANALLSACATVALTAYQKKQQTLRRLELATGTRAGASIAALPDPAPTPEQPREWAAVAPEPRRGRRRWR